jgi:hypothetical protein
MPVYDIKEEIDFEKYIEEEGANYEKIEDYYKMKIDLDDETNNKLNTLKLKKGTSSFMEMDLPEDFKNQKVRRIEWYYRAFQKKDYLNEEQLNEDYEQLFTPNFPNKMTEDDIYHYYTISNADHQKWFKFTGYGETLDNTFQIILHRGIMLRPHILPVIKHLEKMKNNLSNPQEDYVHERGYLFVGEKLCGKTACLTAIVHWAYTNNFLVMYIPYGICLFKKRLVLHF